MNITDKDMESSTRTDSSIEDIAKRLQLNVASQNYVYAVGYSLERVHSGTLASLLRPDDHISRSIAAAIWNWGTPNGISAAQITSVGVDQEVRLGRKCVTDLVVTIRAGAEPMLIVMEYKVDGTSGHEEQCRRMSEFTGEGDQIYFTTLGGAEFLDGPKRWKHLDARIRHFRLKDMLDLLMPFRQDRALLPRYIEALEDEQIRRKNALSLAELIENEQRIDGYRLGYRRFDWWYAVYDQMRHWMPDGEDGEEKNWSIWNGKNNAVMNWLPGSEDNKSSNGSVPGYGHIYVEMRNDCLTGCIGWNTSDRAKAGSLVRAAYSAMVPYLAHLRDLFNGNEWKQPRRILAPNQWGTWGSIKVPFTEDGAKGLATFVKESFAEICKSIKEELNS